MHIRLLNPLDTPAVKALWHLSFPEDSTAFVDWFFQTRYRPDYTWGLFLEGKLLANLQAFPQRIRLRGKELAVHMIVGAATHPDARRQGHMNRLIRHVFHALHNDHAASILYPFRYSFYRQMGYATVSERILASIPTSALPLSPTHGAAPIRGESEFSTLHAIQREFCRRFDGHALPAIEDTRLRFEEFQLEGANGLLAESKEWFAYFSQKDAVCTLHHIAYTSLAALHACLLACAHVQKSERIVLPLPKMDTLYEWLPDARGFHSLEPFLMLRILNIPDFLLGMTSRFDGSITIQIHDSVSDESAQWHIESKDRQIVRVSRVAASQRPDSTLSMIDFTRWACGMVSASELAFEGVENADILAFLAPQSNYFYDMY